MAKPKLKASVENTSVDSGSSVFSTWLSGGQLTQKPYVWDCYIAVGTAVKVSAEYSSAAAGTSPWATLALNSDASLTANALYGFTIYGEASMYVNFKVSATATVELFKVVERYLDW